MTKRRERYLIWTEDTKMCYYRKGYCKGCPLSFLDIECRLIMLVLKIFARCGAPKEPSTNFLPREIEAFNLMLSDAPKKYIDSKIKGINWQMIYNKLGLSDNSLYTYKYEKACALVTDLVNNGKIKLKEVQ